MGDESLPTTIDRTLQQAIVTIKKGSYLLKCGRRGKPKFSPFRLSKDENYLIWYSGNEEKQLLLSSVTKIVSGQNTVNFRHQLQPDKECQSFSLIYANGERSLDLICKDKAQANCWFLALKAVISRSHHVRPLHILRNRRAVQSCFSSPAGYIRRKHNLGLTVDVTDVSQVHSLYGSPTQSLSERFLSDGSSYPSVNFYVSEPSLLQMHSMADILMPYSPCIQLDSSKESLSCFPGTECQRDVGYQFAGSTHGIPPIEISNPLKDVFVWGRSLDSGFDKLGNNNVMQEDALLPKLMESTIMLDVQNISLGSEHAALVTKQGEVFCWGEGKGGRLGNKGNMNMSYPNIVDSLNGIHVKLASCGGHQTCALTQDGELYTWGDNICGADVKDDERNINQWLPHKLSGTLDGVTIANVSCGEWHTAIVSTRGQLFTFGDGTFGVLGHGNLQSISQPKEVHSLKGVWVKSIACGSWHTAAIVEIMVEHHKFNPAGGKLFTWGDADKGRLGHADQENKLLPTCVIGLVDHDFVQVSCGRMLTVGLTDLGQVHTIGSVVHGQLGNPMAKDKSITRVEWKLKEEFIKEISSGSYHVAAVTSGGSVYTWGKGGNGQLGLGDTEDRNFPTLVEALRNRQVERISCGSSFTAAICLHKSVSVGDQSSCSGCRSPFGFTRKRRNCYNCGLLFCGACSSKKFFNASLAPKKSKLFRVCDSCFIHLQSITSSGRLLNLESCSERPLSTSNKAISYLREDMGVTTPRGHQWSSIRQTHNAERPFGEKKTLKGQGENLQLVEQISSSVGMPHWGHVSCPAVFETYCNENTNASNNHVSSLQKTCLSMIPQNLKSTINAINSDNDRISKQDKMLEEEIQRLTSKVRDLERQCEIGNRKIRDYQLTTDDTWSLAKEEAATCKAAKEVIKALTLRLHSMSDKISVGKEADTDIAPTVNKEYPTRICVSSNSNSKAGISKDRQIGSLSSSPVTDTLKSMKRRDVYHNAISVDLPVSRVESQENKTNNVVHEWVEQSEPGVYVTLIVLPSGQKGLKRVRFSRKRFSEKEAELWWEENQVKVYQKYGIEGYRNSCQNHKND